MHLQHWRFKAISGYNREVSVKTSSNSGTISSGLIALTDFQSALPPIRLDQEDSLERLTVMHSARAPEDLKKSVAPLVKRYGVKPPKISFRRFEAIDFGERSATIQERALFFNDRATRVFEEIYNLGDNLQDSGQDPNKIAPEHLIHVTCTGYVSPSAAQLTVNKRGWADRTRITHAYHMGCYAALPAVRIAEGFIAALNARGNSKARADIFHTEMCALHMNPSNTSPEQLVVQSLFADGHMKYSAVHPSLVTHGFEVLSIQERILNDSENDMTWIPADGGMQMTLSRDVPSKIASALRPFIEDLVSSSGLDLAETLKSAIFAVHPGGPKIIDSVQEVLELSESQVAHSKEILRERGNMSSATLPHVWQKLLETQTSSHGRVVVSLAFGPGLTIFGAVFRVIDHRS